MHMHVLLIEPSTGPLNDLAPELASLDFVVQQASTIELAQEAVVATPLLAMVVIDDSIGRSEGVAFVAYVKERHPDLPVLWVGDASAMPFSSFGEHTPDLILKSPVDREAIPSHAKHLLRQHLYPDSLVDLVRDRAQMVFLDGFSTDVNPGPVCLRANRSTLATVSAILSFCGSGLSGRIVVSGAHDHLATVFRRIVPGEAPVSDFETEDLAGEMANQILGRLKEYYVQRGQIFGITSPVYLRGDVAVRYKAGRPSLVLPFEEAEGTLFVQFCIDTSNPAVGTEPAAEHAEDMAQGGDLVFL
jgi:CheY-specific phosphatase CheX